MSRKLVEQPEGDGAENTQFNSTALQRFKVIKLWAAQPEQKVVFCVAGKDTKLETVDQVYEDLRDKVRMVTLCNVVKWAPAV